MGTPGFWIAYSVIFGLLAGALYTWVSGRRHKWWSLLLRAWAVYTLLALLGVWLLYRYS